MIVLASLAPARRRLVVAVVATAILLAAVGALVAVTGHRARGPAVAQDRPGPVLLVPGYGGSPTALLPLAEALRSSGRQVRVVTLPDNAEGDLDTQAVALGAAVTAVRQRTGAGSVDVVGYSAGGVVARLWVRNHGGAGVARRVVTLGSPQHGTELAALGALVAGACPVACQQLAPSSSVLAALNRGAETPAGPSWLSLWTTHDTIVVPPESAELAGAINLSVQSLCPGDAVDHGGLPRDHVVQRVVLRALAASPMTVPTTGC